MTGARSLRSFMDGIPVRTPARGNLLQRRCACGQHTGGGSCQRCDAESTVLRRRAAGPAASPAVAPPVVHDVVGSAGRPLDGQTRSFFETSFGRDFSQVRVHTDARAAQSASAVDAVAYTHGHHIVFGAGQYSPATSSGRELLGHELTHTIQQSGASSSSSAAAIEIGAADSAAEREAESASQTVRSGRPLVRGSVSGFTLQRQAAAAPAAAGAGPRSTPEDFGIAVAVVDHGAGGVKAAAEARLRQVFNGLNPANLAEFQRNGIARIEMHIIPYDKKLTDLTEFAGLRGTRTHDGRLYDEIRGVAGSLEGSTLLYAVAEEELPGGRHSHGAAIGLGIFGGIVGGAGGAALGVIAGQKAQGGAEGPGGAIGGVIGGIVGAGLLATGFALAGNSLDESTNYPPGHVPTHEGTHTIELYGLTPDQRRRVDALYQSRKAAGGPWLPPADYTASTVHEYFANSASAYFSAPSGTGDASMYTPEWLQANDPGMYALMREIFSAGRPAGRNDMLEMRYRASAAA